MTPSKRIVLLGNQFRMSSLWQGISSAGLWYAPDDLTTGYQESTGVTAGAINSPTGLRLDKRLGLVLGPELIAVAADRDFSSDTGFWTKNVGVTIGSGACQFGAVTGGTGMSRAGVLVVGKWYEVTYTVTSISAGNTRIWTDGALRSTPGTFTERYLATTTNFGILAAVAPTTCVIDNISVKLLDGNHSLQATSAARPTLKLDGAIYSDLFDGTDDGYATAAFAAGTLTSNMDCFIAVKRNSAANGIAAAKGPADLTNFLGCYESASASSPSSNVGSPTYTVDGTLVAAATRGTLHTALTVGAWHILEVRGADLSAWTALSVGATPGYLINGNIGGVVLCPAQTDARRAQIRRSLAAKVGAVVV